MDDWFLLGKLMLNQQSMLEGFRKSVLTRADEACKRMGLSKDLYEIRCFCSLDKESFTVNDDGRHIVFIDKHQMDSVFCLTMLYYLYGQPDIKYGIYSFLYERFPYFTKRLAYSLLVLQSEKCVLQRNLLQAKAYLCAAQTKNFVKELRRIQNRRDTSPEFDAVFSLIFLKSQKQDACFRDALTFFVFHELAHVKYAIEKNAMSHIEKVLTVVLSHAGRYEGSQQ